MTELKRCPFCGAEPPTVKVLHPLDINMANWVVCGKCGVKYGTNATKRIKHGQKTRQLYIPTILL